MYKMFIIEKLFLFFFIKLVINGILFLVIFIELYYYFYNYIFFLVIMGNK